jgi:hypothetical protein
VPLLTRSTPDAEKLLGSTYPFFVDDEETLAAAETAFDRMEYEFGGKIWNDAINAITEMGNLTSASANADRVRELIKELS